MLKQHDFNTQTLHIWSRGVDTNLYYPREPDEILFPKIAGPIFMYVGRVSFEKGIDEFLKLPLVGTKYVVGLGPELPSIQREYPDAIYLGYLENDALAAAYSNADVVVFPR